MASQTTPKKPRYQSKKRLLEETDNYEITKVVPVQECYVDKATLHAYKLAVFTGSFKTEADTVWSVTILPEEFWQYNKHGACSDIFSKVGLGGYFSLPAWGMDIKRCYQLLETLNEDGEATIDGPDNQPITVTITEEIIRDALKVTRGDNSLISRNTPQENSETFVLTGQSDFTFKDLVRREIELPLRVYTQHFTHGKAPRYTKPHRRIATMFTRAHGSKFNLNLRFTEIILTELKAFATRLKNNKNLHMNCCHMMTRICYYAVGMIDDLPPPINLDQWLAVCTAPPPVTIKAEGETTSTPKKKKGTKTRAQSKGKKISRATPSESSASTSSESSEEEVDSEETETDEEQRKLKEELSNRPAVSKQRKQWEDISKNIRKKEQRAKIKQDRRKERNEQKEKEKLAEEEREIQRQERAREIAESNTAAEKQRKRILKALKRKADEEAKEQEETAKKPRIEKVDVPPASPPASPPPSPKRSEDTEMKDPKPLPSDLPDPQSEEPQQTQATAEEEENKDKEEKGEAEKQTSPDRPPPPSPRSPRRILTFETVEGTIEHIELNAGSIGQANGSLPNGKEMEKEVPQVSDIPTTERTSQVQTTAVATVVIDLEATTAAYTTMGTETILEISTAASTPSIVSISIPSPVPTSIPIPTLDQTHAETITHTAPLSQVDIISTTTPHTDLSISATEPAHTSPGPLVHISTLAQTSVDLSLPSLITNISTALDTSTLGAPTFVQADTTITTTTLQEKEEASTSNLTMGEATTSVEAMDVSQSFRMPEYLPEYTNFPIFGGIRGATAMIAHYLSYINAESQQSHQKQMEIQTEMEELKNVQAILVKQIEENNDKLDEREDAFKDKASQLYLLEEEYELEKGRSQCYKLQMEEISGTLTRERQEHADALAQERSYTHDEIQLKEKEVDTVKRALAMTRRRLQQAEDTINTFMENPTEDPTTDASKNAQIERLQEEVKELRILGQVVNEGVKMQMLAVEKENEDLKLQVEMLRRQLDQRSSVQPQSYFMGCFNICRSSTIIILSA